MMRVKPGFDFHLIEQKDTSMVPKLTLAVVLTMTLALGVVLTPSNVHAAENTGIKSTDSSNDDEQALTYEQALNRIESQKKTIKDLRTKIGKASGILQKALESRLIKARMKLLEQRLSFAREVAEQENAGTKNDEHRKQAIETLGLLAKATNSVAADIRKRIVLPEADLSAGEQAATYSRIFELLNTLNHSYEVYIESLGLMRQFELDVTSQEKLLREDLGERAANGSILLEMTMANVTALQASTSAVPDDAEIKAKLNVAINHVSSLANGLSTVLAMMDSVGMDTTNYQEQLLNATGQITSNVFEVGVFTNLFIGWSQTLWSVLIESGPGLLFKIVLFFIIVYVFRKLSNLAQKLAETGLAKSQIKLSLLLRRMVISIVRNTILIIGILIALSQVGINLGPLLAGLGVVGFVIGFALQDTLSNFAAGMLILIYRPFDVKDLVEAGGVSGTVSDMSLVNTTILTLDNQTIVVPNNKIWGDVIKNVTAQTIRRIDLVFGIAYTDDIVKTEKVLQEIVDSQEAVLDQPETMIRMHELAESSVNFIVRPWVNRDDYWETYWAITRAVKIRFDEEGISIPFPQSDVHLYKP
jgi:small conductance mechanosensitive channel